MGDNFNEMLAYVLKVFGGEIIFSPKKPDRKRKMKWVKEEWLNEDDTQD